jgi:polygalacturonase
VFIISNQTKFNQKKFKLSQNTIMYRNLSGTIILSIILISFASFSNAQKYKNITNNEIKAFYKDIPFEMPLLKTPKFKNNVVKITDFGAVGDGVTLNTDAFAKAIEEVSKKGGGKVVVPSGIWLTGPITLKSNINLFLEKNSLIVFSKNFDLYPIIDTNFEGLNTKRCQSPISAFDAENIAITGYGVIDGSGDAWRPVKKEKLTERQFKNFINSGGVLSADKKMWFPSLGSLKGQGMCVDQNVPVGPQTDAEWMEIRDFLRPVMINFVRSKNILLEGVTFQNSPAWNIHPFICENVIVNNITVRNPWYSQNGDGIDIESCKNTLIVNSKFDVGDDAICMKSGKNEEGRARNIPTENVIVDNCVVYHGHGGFVVGSEMSGGIRNIKVTNCDFIGTDVGLRFKSNRGRGGVVENIWISNIIMKDIPTDPLLFDLFYGGKSAIEAEDDETPNITTNGIPPVNEETPAFRNIYIENIISSNSNRAMYFNGLPEMKVDNVKVKNSVFSSKIGAVINQTTNVELTNIKIDNKTGDNIEIQNVENGSFINIADHSGKPGRIKQSGKNSNIVIKN